MILSNTLKISLSLSLSSPPPPLSPSSALFGSVLAEKKQNFTNQILVYLTLECYFKLANF